MNIDVMNNLKVYWE